MINNIARERRANKNRATFACDVMCDVFEDVRYDLIESLRKNNLFGKLCIAQCFSYNMDARGSET